MFWNGTDCRILYETVSRAFGRIRDLSLAYTGTNISQESSFCEIEVARRGDPLN